MLGIKSVVLFTKLLFISTLVDASVTAEAFHRFLYIASNFYASQGGKNTSEWGVWLIQQLSACAGGVGCKPREIVCGVSQPAGPDSAWTHLSRLDLTECTEEALTPDPRPRLTSLGSTAQLFFGVMPQHFLRCWHSAACAACTWFSSASRGPG